MGGRGGGRLPLFMPQQTPSFHRKSTSQIRSQKFVFLFKKMRIHCGSHPDAALGMALTASAVDMLWGAAGARPDKANADGQLI